jgi:hypothetical protein
VGLKRRGTLTRTILDPCMNSRHICFTIRGVKVTIGQQCISSRSQSAQDISYTEDPGEMCLSSCTHQADHVTEVFQVFIYVLIYPVMNASRF